jgi:hypothetical protein
MVACEIWWEIDDVVVAYEREKGESFEREMDFCFFAEEEWKRVRELLLLLYLMWLMGPTSQVLLVLLYNSSICIRYHEYFSSYLFTYFQLVFKNNYL